MIDRKKLEEIIAGCEGVTPGPWNATSGSVETADENYSNGTSGWREPGNSIAHLYDGEYIENPNAAADAAHIARLDPTTVKAMAERIIALEDGLAQIDRMSATPDSMANLFILETIKMIATNLLALEKETHDAE